MDFDKIEGTVVNGREEKLKERKRRKRREEFDDGDSDANAGPNVIIMTKEILMTQVICGVKWERHAIITIKHRISCFSYADIKRRIQKSIITNLRGTARFSSLSKHARG